MGAWTGSTWLRTERSSGRTLHLLQHNCDIKITFKAMFCIYLRTNSDLCHLQHKLIGFYNRDEKCLLRGTDWVFK